MNERELLEELNGIRERITAIIKEVDPKFDDADDGLPYTEDYLAYEERSRRIAETGMALRCGTCEHCMKGFEFLLNSGEQTKRVRCMSCYHVTTVRRNNVPTR
jgi:hypothetical protein